MVSSRFAMVNRLDNKVRLLPYIRPVYESLYFLLPGLDVHPRVSSLSTYRYPVPATFPGFQYAGLTCFVILCCSPSQPWKGFLYRCRRLVMLLPDHNHPGHSHQFVGQRHHRLAMVSCRYQALNPTAQGIRFSTRLAHHRSGTMHHQGSKGCVATLADAPQLHVIPTGGLPGYQT